MKSLSGYQRPLAECRRTRLKSERRTGVRVQVPRGRPSRLSPRGRGNCFKPSSGRVRLPQPGPNEIIFYGHVDNGSQRDCLSRSASSTLVVPAISWASSSFRRAPVLQTGGAGSEAQEVHQSMPLSSNGRKPVSLTGNVGSIPASGAKSVAEE